jgi:choline-phosphate cytidylyltransferase
MRIYVDGVFDLFHYGHAEMLARVREAYGPTCILIAGIARDEDCMKYKRTPILTHDERIRSLRACKYVDEVIENAPWIITQEFLDRHRIDYVCHDDAPYPSVTHDDVYAYVKSIGKFQSIDRTPGISTSELLERIKSRT